LDERPRLGRDGFVDADRGVSHMQDTPSRSVSGAGKRSITGFLIWPYLETIDAGPSPEERGKLAIRDFTLSS
jgi:hypothetical protein